MGKFGACGYMIAWEPFELDKHPPIKVGPHPDETGWTRAHNCTTGCDTRAFVQMDTGDRQIVLLGLVLRLIIQYDIPATDVLDALHALPDWYDMDVLQPMVPTSEAQKFLTERPNRYGHSRRDVQRSSTQIR